MFRYDQKLMEAARDAALLDAQKDVADTAKQGFADVMYNRLISQITDFEKDLDSDHEIGAYLASFGKETRSCQEFPSQIIFFIRLII